MGESTDKVFWNMFSCDYNDAPLHSSHGPPYDVIILNGERFILGLCKFLRIGFVQIKLWMCCGVFISLSNALNVAINWTGSRGRLSITVTDYRLATAGWHCCTVSADLSEGCEKQLFCSIQYIWSYVSSLLSSFGEDRLSPLPSVTWYHTFFPLRNSRLFY